MNDYLGTSKCPNCAYELADLPGISQCPSCGHVLPTHPALRPSPKTRAEAKTRAEFERKDWQCLNCLAYSPGNQYACVQCEVGRHWFQAAMETEKPHSRTRTIVEKIALVLMIAGISVLILKGVVFVLGMWIILTSGRL